MYHKYKCFSRSSRLGEHGEHLYDERSWRSMTLSDYDRYLTAREIALQGKPGASETVTVTSHTEERETIHVLSEGEEARLHTPAPASLRPSRPFVYRQSVCRLHSLPYFPSLPSIVIFLPSLPPSIIAGGC